MLKILVNSFKKEFDLKNSISYVYLYLSTYTDDFASLNKHYLISVYKTNINYILSRLIANSFEINKSFYISASSNFADLNKFISLLEKILLTKNI